MYHIRNARRLCRGLHKLRKEMKAREYKAVYKNDWWQLEEVRK
jgi:hypothetical protein